MYRNAAMLAGVVSCGIALLFLGWMTISINSLPLWIVMVVTMGMLVFDFYQAMKEEKAEDEQSSA
jgi:Na+-transporting methylmalonyl-CoA/oxaloacetate decarboxylase gamma subunit